MRVALEAAHSQEIADLMKDPQAGKHQGGEWFMPTRMQKIWRRYDKDGNGMLDANEVKPLMVRRRLTRALKLNCAGWVAVGCSRGADHHATK